MEKNNSTKILVISLSNIGDALLCYPALELLWKNYPAARTEVLASARTKLLYQSDPRFSRVCVLENKADIFRQAIQVARLSSQRYSVVVDFRHSIIPFFLLGARRTPILRGSAPEGVHRALVHQALVKKLLGKPLSVSGYSAPGFPFSADDLRTARNLLLPGKTPVILVPGARSHLKRWPSERFASIADRLIDEQNAQVLLIGEESEQPIVSSVMASMRHSAVNLAGKTSLAQFMALLSLAKLVITNDSASLHAAELMGVPSVAIFGPTDEKKYGPRHPRSVVVRRTMICAPCELALCPYAHECMELIPSEEVYAAAVRILNG